MKMVLMVAALAAFNTSWAQCYTSPNGQWPSATFTPSCGVSCSFQNITTIAWNGEYSVVNVVAGNNYTFRSSVATDYITVDNNGAAPLVGVAGVSGAGGVSWTATFTGTVRFYTHNSSTCGSNTTSRTRSVCCTGTPPPPPTPPANDACAGAIGVNCGQSVTATTVNATTDAAGSSFCGTTITTPGVWYKITGNGQQMTASTCGSGDTKMIVYSGSCAGLSCVGGNDDNGPACSGTASSVSWTSVNGTTYYVLVAQFSGTGSFPFVVNCSPLTVANDNCSGAQSIACGGQVTVNTQNANTDAAGGNFCGTTITTPGVWYTVTGNGQNYTASTVGLTGVDTKLMVFSGSCTGLSCVGGNDDASGLQSSVSWTSVSGTVYYILAATYSGTGTFPMSLTCTTPYNPCTNISNIASCGTSSNINLPSGSGIWNNYGSPFSTPGSEQIFSFTPTVTASYPITVTNNGSGWIDLFVRTAGACNSNGWTYIDDISGTVTNNVTLTAGVTYYFLLDDEDSNGSTGSITVDCPCIGSAVDGSYTYSGPLSISGTTVGACDDNALRAGFDRTYAVTISCAGDYTFSLCGATWDTYLYLTSAVGSGIIASNDDFCSLQSQLTTSLAAGTYYVTIEGFTSSSVGAFNLSVSGTGSAPSITGASSSNVSCNGGSNGSISASINGNGNAATATLNGNAFSGTASGLSAGNYTLVASNCWGSTTQTFTIGQPTVLDASASSGSIACNGGSTTVTVSATGGTAPYSGTGSFTVGAGTYSYTVTDANGCVDVVNITVTEPTALSASSTSGSIACFGGTTRVTVAASGGTAPYSGVGDYTVGAGSYTYTVTDANGCQATTTITVTEPTQLTASSTSGVILCNGGTTTVTVAAAGGTAPYSGTGNYTVGAGIHTYTVTDANGCEATTSITVTEPTAVTANAGNDQAVYYGYQSLNCVTLSGTQSGGVGGYSVRWNVGSANGTLVSSSLTAQVCPTTTTTYCYTVTDANGCSFTDCMTVCVMDIRCGKAFDKVTVCHYPPGNIGNPQTICISANAVPAHFNTNSDDVFGACGATFSCGQARGAAGAEAADMEVAVLPNPFQDATVLRIQLTETEKVNVRVYGMNGNVVATLFDGNADAGVAYSLDFRSENLSNGIYFAKVVTESGKVKVVKMVLNR